MPTYEYKCRECGNRFERFQKMTDPPAQECPSCGGGVRKLMHPPAITFKGPGFYVNDYKNSSAPSRTSSAPSETPPPKAASEKTDEQKKEMKELIGA